MMRRQVQSMVLILIAVAILSLGRWPVGQCQAEAETDNDDDYDRRAKTASNPLVASLFYGKIRNMTRSFSHDTGQQLDYCIKDS